MTRVYFVRWHEYLSLCVFEGEARKAAVIKQKYLLSVGKQLNGVVECVGNENIMLRAIHMRRLAVSPLLVSQSVYCAIVLEWIYVLFAMIFDDF